MPKTVQDILDFIYEWRGKKNISDDISLNDNQIKTFVTELHTQITQMEFSVLEGSTIIAYSGKVNGTLAHEVAEKISGLSGSGAVFISDILAGNNRIKLTRALELEDIYANLISDIARQFMVQTELKLPLAFAFVKKGDETGTKEIDYSFAKTYFEEKMKEDIDGTIRLVSIQG